MPFEEAVGGFSKAQTTLIEEFCKATGLGAEDIKAGHIELVQEAIPNGIKWYFRLRRDSQGATLTRSAAPLNH